MKEIGRVLAGICRLSERDLELTLDEMQKVLDHNYNLFYSQAFIDGCWNELQTGLSKVCESIPTVPGLQESIDKYLARVPVRCIVREIKTYG